jgi:superfamily II DNA or RNA helicase
MSILTNGQALCPSCNLKKGSNMIRLRPWQQDALEQAEKWLVDERKDRHFLINAAPGAGKTIAACVIAERLIRLNEIDRVVVIAPRSEIVNQWAEDFKRVTGRYMGKVTGGDGDIESLGIDVCATWAAVQRLADGFQAVCRRSRTLLICDEHHHAAVKAAWGEGADSAFKDANFVLILTGTPIRSDRKQSVWLAYDDDGAIDHPEEGTYTLTYGEAVDLNYCRPVTFHRHEGLFTVDLEDGDSISVSSKSPAELSDELKRVPGLQRALNFYRLACTPQFEADNKTPLLSGYQATMLDYASQKLTDLRYRMPDAGGLVIAPTIEMAEYMVKLIGQIEGEEPVLVHSQAANSENKIRAFRQTDKRWIVSVAMISEGVDIKRLRVLVYLPNALTELAFRQAIGRVVRTHGPDDDTRAYIVMPSFDILEAYARRVEDELSPGQRSEGEKPRTKRCPACASEVPLGTKTCPTCEHEFPSKPPRLKNCPECDSLNPLSAKSCQNCGASFEMRYVLTLDDALRTGAIVRGMDIEEADVREGEGMANEVRKKVLGSGDERLVRLIKQLPEETWGRLKNILND